MEKKTLTALVIVLGIIVIFESICLFELKKKRHRHARSIVYTAYLPETRPAIQDNFAAQDWDPAAQMRSMQRQADSLFDSSFVRSGQRQKNDLRSIQPDFLLQEAAGGYRMKVDLPGMDKKDINVKCSGRLLTVSAQRAASKVSEGEQAYQEEEGYGYFLRTLTLPRDADTSKISSDYSNGVLTVNIPRLAVKKAPLESSEKK